MSQDHATAFLSLDVDATRCAGHGRCYSLLPELFEPDDEGMAIVTDLGRKLPAVRERDSVTAVECCPEHAINVSTL